MGAAEGPPPHSATARTVLTSKEHELYFSLCLPWEIAVKMKIGKLNTVGSSVTYIRDEMAGVRVELLPIRLSTSWNWSGCRSTTPSPSTAC